jgi:hypothetical protein
MAGSRISFCMLAGEMADFVIAIQYQYVFLKYKQQNEQVIPPDLT